MNIKDHALKLILTASIIAAVPASGAIVFSFDYNDPSNNGLWAQPRKDSLDRAAAALATYFTPYTATIEIQIKSENSPASSTLASAASNGNGSLFTAGFASSDVVMNKILTGVDQNGATFDGIVNVNWGVNWDLSSTAAGVSLTGFDFESTMIHELLHAMGFLSTINQNGTDGFGSGVGSAGDWNPFDQWVGNSTGLLINQTSFEINAPAFTLGLTGGAGPAGLGFWGPNALAANGGQPVWLYTPLTYQDGSSGSHLDDQFAPYNFIMEAATNPGPGIRPISSVELGILRDIGYTQVVPEPASGLLAALGAGLVTFARRRRG